MALSIPYLRGLAKKDICFSLFMVLFFLIPGAYLEYPSDPWEHYKRIFLWDGCDRFESHYTAQKFSYFWAWSLLSYLPLEARRVGTHFFSTFTQLLLALHIWTFARLISPSKDWQRLHTFAFFCFFGTSLFGMRYYALSSTPFAYVGYLAFLGYWFCFIKQQKQPPWLLAASILVMASNHVQTLLFAALSLLAVFVEHWLETKRVRNLKKAAAIAGVIFVVGLLFGTLGMHFFRSEFVGTMQGRNVISRFGTFKVWAPQLKVLETLGIHGLLALFLGILYFQRLKFLLLIVSVPILSLLFPPFVFLIAQFAQFDVPYRILYAGPTSFLLIAGFNHLFRKKYAVWMGTGITLILGLLYMFPWRGRLFFQLHTSSVERNLRFLDETLAWFGSHPDFIRNCMILSDDITMFALHTNFPFKTTKPVVLDQFSRLPPLKVLAREVRFINFFEQIEYRIKQENPKICGLLIANPKLLPQSSGSRIAKSSGHWPESMGEIRSMISSREFEWSGAIGAINGYRRIKVPPFYDFYPVP